jgi:NADPH-dependent ferric siderophore reductase
MRIIFGGEELSRFGTDGFDQRIKILFPLPGDRWGDPHLFDDDSIAGGLWYQQWKALDNPDRNPVRTYTIRKIDPRTCRLTVDFVVHDDAGPAGAFARNCAVGERVVVIGPDCVSKNSAIGIDFHPAASRHLLLVGDETAVPALSAILEQLHDAHWDGSGLAVMEVPHPDDVLPIRMPQHFRLYQQPRADGEAGGVERGTRILERLSQLAAAGDVSSAPDRSKYPVEDVTDLSSDADFLWEVPPQAPDDGLYAWVAGEALMVRSIRRFLIAQLGLERSRVAFMGYWREGKKEI